MRYVILLTVYTTIIYIPITYADDNEIICPTVMACDETGEISPTFKSPGSPCYEKFLEDCVTYLAKLLANCKKEKEACVDLHVTKEAKRKKKNKNP